MTDETITIKLTVTGNAQIIDETIKSIFTKSEVVPTIKALNVTSTAHKQIISKRSMRSELVPGASYKSKSIRGENLKLATSYIKNKNQVRFTDLIQHILKNNSTNLSPSSAQIARFLTKQKFKKFKFTLADNTTFIAWERDQL
jgi:hypothetical protein